jgi:UDP-N-acetylmuramoyl-L-alanyl-D-glutamate--2,6-diaminopimelate ligase
MAAWTLNDWLAPWLTLTDDRRIGPPALDSRRLERGGVFLACAGEREHGLNYLASALDAGASVIVWEPGAAIEKRRVESDCAAAGVVAVALDALGQRAGELAARYYGEPGADLVVLGVTGTDGKTSVTQFVARALGGEPGGCAVIGTLGWGWPDRLQPSELTTPDAVTLQAWLAAVRDDGAQAVAMEVSSHALAQRRVDAVPFDVAVLTNLGHDHLDYHGSREAYRAAKRRLFDIANPVPVLNLDDTWGAALADELNDRQPVGYTMRDERPARVCCRRFQPEPGGMTLELIADASVVSLRLPVMGRFNVSNVLAAAGGVVAAGVEPARLPDCLARIQPVAGRMEPIAADSKPTVVVDYAHTPGALEAALAAVREHCRGHLWLVFGCGGDRDRMKRSTMGGIAERDADRVVLTNDNPRHEDPERIIGDICSRMAGEVTVLLDRRHAIRYAIGTAADEDCVLIAGKGHETWQVSGTQRQPFSDRDEASLALREVV